MTFRQFRSILGRLFLASLLILINLLLIMRRASDPESSSLDQALGLSLDPLLVLSALVTMTVPPLWLGRSYPLLRGRLQGYTGMLLIANAVGLAILLAAPSPPNQAVAVPTATPISTPRQEDGKTTRPPVRPSRRSTFLEETAPTVMPTPAKTPDVAVTPTLEPSPTPTHTGTPRPVPRTIAKPLPKPKVEPYAKIDAHALAAPKSVEKDIATLARYLVKPAKNDRDKIRAIHRWVSDRIAYDVVSFNAGEYPDQSAENTLRTRLSVCAGYANLVHALGEAAGIQTVVVSGYARTLDSSEMKSDREGHAWNAVKLEGKWRLLDSTWSAGSADTHFRKEYNDFYFLTEPSAFLNSHWPEKNKWQLVEAPMSWEQFQRQPLLLTPFYSSGIEVALGTSRKLKAQPEAVLALTLPEDVLLTVQLEDAKGTLRKGAATVARRGEQATVRVKAPAPGAFTLILYAGKDETSACDAVATFQVQATKGDSAGYPETTTVLQRHEVDIVEPREGVVSPGPRRFELHVPGATAVFVDQWANELERDGDHFSGEIDLQVGEAEVYAQLDKPYAEPLVSYRVRWEASGETKAGPAPR